MGELLFATTCVPDESCDDSWFLSLYFVAAVIVVVLLMYQEDCFALINKLFGKIQGDKSEEPNGINTLKSEEIHQSNN